LYIFINHFIESPFVHGMLYTCTCSVEPSIFFFHMNQQLCMILNYGRVQVQIYTGFLQFTEIAQICQNDWETQGDLRELKSKTILSECSGSLQKLLLWALIVSEIRLSLFYPRSAPGFILCYNINIMGDKLLLNFGAKFQP